MPLKHKSLDILVLYIKKHFSHLGKFQLTNFDHFKAQYFIGHTLYSIFQMLSQSLLDCHKTSCQAGKPLALRVFVCGRNRQENEGAIALAQAFKVNT